MASNTSTNPKPTPRTSPGGAYVTPPTAGWRASIGDSHFIEKRLGPEQIDGREAFGKSGVDRSQQIVRFRSAALFVSEPRETRCRSQFPGQRTLLACRIQRLLQQRFRNRSIANMFSREGERFDSQQLGRAPARQPVFRPCNGFVSQQAFIQCAQSLAKQWVAQRIQEQGRESFRSAVLCVCQASVPICSDRCAALARSRRRLRARCSPGSGRP